MGKFLESVQGQEGPRPAADGDPQEGGDALDIHMAKRDALKSDEITPRLSAPKFSTGPRSTMTRFPTKTATTREAP